MGVLAVAATEVEVEPLGEARDHGVGDISAQARDVRDDLRPAPSAEVRRLPRDVAYASLHRDRFALAVETKDRRRTAGGVDHPHEQLDRRRFARSVRSEKAEDLALPDVEIEVEDPPVCAVILAESQGRDRRGRLTHLSHCLSRPPSGTQAESRPGATVASRPRHRHPSASSHPSSLEPRTRRADRRERLAQSGEPATNGFVQGAGGGLRGGDAFKGAA